MMDLVRDVLGRERAIAKRYPDGSFNCPFCVAAVPAPAERCENPGCPASHWAHANPACVEIFREREAAEERRRADDAQRRANTEAALRRSCAAREERAARFAEIVAEAQRRGACVRCATADPYRAPRFIRHRKACPRGAAR